MADASIQIEGIQDVLRGLEKSRVAINREASLGLRKAGMNIIADSQVNLRQNGSWTTGLLANMGRVIYGGKGYDTGSDNGLKARAASDSLLGASDAGADLGLDAGFFDQRTNFTGYAKFVEYGRKSGKMPPPDALEGWVKKKFSPSSKRAVQSLCWALAVTIGRKGTRPHPFFGPAVQKNYGRIVSILQDAISKVTR